MDGLMTWITQHAEHAHWFAFGMILLAGVNIPISIDVLLASCALLAATIVPDHVWHLYLAVFLGSYFSAWIAYGIGRVLAGKLSRFRWFSRLFPAARMEKIQKFYKKHGFWTLIIGRFIPFGVRNCIFMSSGMSRSPFVQFILRDLPACFIWSSAVFYLFFALGKHVHFFLDHLKMVNLGVFLVFSVTVILILWYKRKRKQCPQNR